MRINIHGGIVVKSLFINVGEEFSEFGGVGRISKDAPVKA